MSEIFYLLFTPRDQTLKIGKAKDFENVLLRLQERRRQCGVDTKILGFKVCDKASLEESAWKDRLSVFSISREVFDLSPCDFDFLWLNNFCLDRKIIECVEREKDVFNCHWHPDAIKSIDLEKMIKDYLAWNWDGENDDPTFPDLVELIEVT